MEFKRFPYKCDSNVDSAYYDDDKTDIRGFLFKYGVDASD